MQSGPPVAQKMRLHSRTMSKKMYIFYSFDAPVSREIFDKCTEINALWRTLLEAQCAEMLWVIVNIIIKWPWRHYELWSLVHSGSVGRRRSRHAEKCSMHMSAHRLCVVCECNSESSAFVNSPAYMAIVSARLQFAPTSNPCAHRGDGCTVLAEKSHNQTHTHYATWA